MRTGAELIAEERQRQKDVEGWTDAHDDKHVGGELVWAAACYAAPNDIYEHERGLGSTSVWPWDRAWDKRIDRKGGVLHLFDISSMSAENIVDRVKELAKAGALVAAEIDRLQRAYMNKQGR